jgi:hypothetical protein
MVRRFSSIAEAVSKSLCVVADRGYPGSAKTRSVFDTALRESGVIFAHPALHPRAHTDRIDK